MRVPSVGLSSEERRIVAEGYRLAEHMLRNYQDKPSLFAVLGRWLEGLRMMLQARS